MTPACPWRFTDTHPFLVAQVDPSLLGGMVVEIGDKRVDMSIASRIKGLCNLLRESV